jgi:small-conductance mechanosensitive channel
MVLVFSWVPLGDGWHTAAVVVGLFVIAYLVTRFSRRLAGRLIERWDKAHFEDGQPVDDTGAIRGLKRRDTAVSLISTTVRYVAFGVALVLSIGQIAGFGKASALAVSSVVIVLVGFAGQRFLTDIIAGLLMFFEGWFSVGDTITVEPWDLSGVVEEVSLRSTTLRAVTGETVRVNNSAFYAARVLPRGVREVDIELFVSDADAARRLIAEVARIVPAGPTRFVRRPRLEEIEVLDKNLIRVLVHTTVAHGREWLVQDFLPELIRERAEAGLLVHGPVVIFVDERATSRFARTVGGVAGAS